LTSTGNITGASADFNSIAFGNGAADYVSAAGRIQYNSITFGNGVGDFVSTTGDIANTRSTSAMALATL
jgi:hypothetical protein